MDSIAQKLQQYCNNIAVILHVQQSFVLLGISSFDQYMDSCE